MNINRELKGLFSAAVAAVGMTAAATSEEVVQLWKDGPYWAASNLGESEVQDHPEYGAFYSLAEACSGIKALGREWRLPTKDDLDKLVDQSVCDRVWDGDRKGWVFTGKGGYSSKSIFLPAAGFNYGEGRKIDGKLGYYWSSDTVEFDEETVWYLDLDSNKSDAASVDTRDCNFGLSVRAVRDTPLPVTINEVKTGDPWNGTKGAITIDYSLADIDAAKQYKVAFDIMADGRTAGVTNAAAKLVEGRQAIETIETVLLFGKEVTDTNAKAKVSLIAVTPEEKVVAFAETEFWLGPGCESCPWTVGESATAYVKDGTLFVNGTGAVTSTPWAADAADITELVKAKDVTGLEDIVATLPALTAVNGLKLAELNGLAVGAVRASGFSTIAVDPATQTATLTLVVKAAAKVDAEEKDWKNVATQNVKVDAAAPAGFFIVVPATK